MYLALFVLAVLGGTTEEGKAWLASKGKEDGVVTLPSGLLYKKIKTSTADEKDRKYPLVNSPCECHYAGTLMDGTEFDSSYSRGTPSTFAPNQVIKGWTEAMQLMAEGDKWELYIPSELAYGDRSVVSFCSGVLVSSTAFEHLPDSEQKDKKPAVSSVPCHCFSR